MIVNLLVRVRFWTAGCVHNQTGTRAVVGT